MSGNVWQWCRDWFAHDFYQRPESRGLDPQNTTPSGLRSERGGSWVGAARLAESSYRRGRPPEAAGRCLGFRCVSQPD
jgi:formylglycine-generating enzyme required for sulfatase activity